MGKTIFIVDDSRFTRVMLRSILEEAGYKVIGEAIDGNETIRKFEQLMPDLTILDIIIPPPEGNVVMAEIFRRNPWAKILIISSVSQRFLVEKALSCGASGYLVKPVDPETVITEVRRILGE